MFRHEFQDEHDVLSLSKMEKCISSDRDMEMWKQSPAYSKLFSILKKLDDSVKSVLRTEERKKSDNVIKVLNILEKCKKNVEKYECGDVHNGTSGFRLWLTEVYETRFDLFKEITDNSEVLDYFCQSFGSWTRVDYGTGHELNFLAFVTSLFEVGFFKDDDCKSVVLDVFWNYWDVVVLIIAKFNLEPAGSHGVWGLDDYIFLPFLFGASQLIDNNEITTGNVIDEFVAKEHEKENSYSRWVAYLRRVKIGGFEQHSRYLYSLQAVPHFEKLANGLVKMYQGEVLNSFPVVQHFRFGQLLKFK